jgi:Uncharacterized conserved protein
MKLYIKQKVFSWGDKFSVVDASGQPRYHVEGEIFSWGKKLHVYDVQGNERVYIRQKVMSWRPRFFVYVDGREVAEVVKEFGFFTPVYSVNGLGWEIEGDFWAHEYMVTERRRPVVAISKQWFTWGDSYVLNILRPSDELPALAVVLAIDCAVAQQESG